MNGPEQSDFAVVQRVVPHYLMRSIEVQLMDGTAWMINLGVEIAMPGVFAPLRDQSVFDSVRVVDGVVSWPGVTDLASEELRVRADADAARKQRIEELARECADWSAELNRRLR